MTTAEAAPLHPHVQMLIDCAPKLDGQRRTELTALLLQARATRNSSEAGPASPAFATTSQLTVSRQEVEVLPG